MKYKFLSKKEFIFVLFLVSSFPRFTWERSPDALRPSKQTLRQTRSVGTSKSLRLSAFVAELL
jgi:hypothetical protein